MSDPDTFAQTSKRFRMHKKSNDSLLVFNRGEDPNIFNNYVGHDGVSVRIEIPFAETGISTQSYIMAASRRFRSHSPETSHSSKQSPLLSFLNAAEPGSCCTVLQGELTSTLVLKFYFT
jgi:hypothetical protein